MVVNGLREEWKAKHPSRLTVLRSVKLSVGGRQGKEFHTRRPVPYRGSVYKWCLRRGGAKSTAKRRGEKTGADVDDAVCRLNVETVLRWRYFARFLFKFGYFSLMFEKNWTTFDCIFLLAPLVDNSFLVIRLYFRNWTNWKGPAQIITRAGWVKAIPCFGFCDLRLPWISVNVNV